MTHTLHPEIEKAILAITQERTVFRSYFDNESDLCKEDKKMIASLIRTYLGPYLLPPSQHPKDSEDLDKEFSKGYDAGVKAARDKIAELEQ